MVARDGIEPPRPAFSGLVDQSLTEHFSCGFIELQTPSLDAIWTPAPSLNRVDSIRTPHSSWLGLRAGLQSCHPAQKALVPSCCTFAGPPSAIVMYRHAV